MINQWSTSNLKDSEEGLHYFEWLCDIVGVYKEEDNVGGYYDSEPGYWYLLRRLWRTEFLWVVPNDDNRIADGLDLRDLYFNGDSDGLNRSSESCSVLEMMIGLAKRMDDMLQMPDEGPNLRIRFLELLDNLDLLVFEDSRYSNKNRDPEALYRYQSDMKKIDRILDNLVGRKYAKNGVGGLFPLTNPTGDQRTVEIWYQMNQYLIENYM